MHKVKFTNVKQNDIMAFTLYTKVTAIVGKDVLTVANLDEGAPSIDVKGLELIENGKSADQFEEEIKVSKTEAARLLSNATGPFTVEFIKKDGTVRLLRGRLLHAEEALLGYSMVEDLDKLDRNNRVRQVDHRTLNFLILNGIKYVVK